MTTKELKLMIDLAIGFAVENVIDNETIVLPGGSIKKVPMTDSWTHSNWSVGLTVRHRGNIIWLWYRGFLSKDGGCQWYFWRSYNTTTGKPMRRDGEIKLRLDFEQRASLSAYDVSDVKTKAYNERYRIVSYHGMEFLLDSEPKGGCFVWLKTGSTEFDKVILHYYNSKLKARVAIKFELQNHPKFLEAMLRLDYTEWNQRQKDADKVSLSEFCEMRVGFKYRGMLVGKNDRGELTFTNPEIQLKIK